MINKLTSIFNNLLLKLRNFLLNINNLEMNSKILIMNIKKEIFKYVNSKECSLENEILPKLINLKKIQGKFFNNFFIDIGSKHFLKLANSKLKKEFYKPAIFLDRDGVINEKTNTMVQDIRDLA